MTSSRRDRGRLKSNYSEVLNDQAAELAMLAREAAQDPDLLDALEACLGRIKLTADSLDLAPVATAAEVAVSACQDEGNVVEKVDRLLEACRRLDGSNPLFRSLLVLTPGGEPTLTLAQTAIDVHTANTLDELQNLARTEAPGAILVPLSQLEEANQFLLDASHLATVPRYVYALDQGDIARELEQRRDAVRLGAAGFVSTPLNVWGVLDRIRDQAQREAEAPFRVLLIDGRAPETTTIREALDPDHFELVVEDSPSEMLATLERLSPELLILDLDLEEGDALELCRVVRSHERFHPLPVMFLASEGSDEHAAAMLAGADDLIHREMGSELLRARMEGRMRRMRQLNQDRERDPVTGLMGAKAFMRSADREIGLSERTEKPLSAAILDLDGVHELEQSRGGAVVERVLQVLVQVLQQALRRTDVLGRVGHDDIAVLMPACTRHQARSRMHRVRQDLAAALEADPRFPDLTVSIGIADTLLFGRALLRRADAELLSTRNQYGPGEIGVAEDE